MLQIRAEKTPDAAGIRAVHLAAFAPRTNEADLVDLLRGAGQASVLLVAISDGRLAGHVLFSPVTLSPAVPRLLGVRGLGLAPLAVLPELQHQGLGSQLVLRGLEVCRAATFDYVVVLGDPRYYSRFGFRAGRQFQLDNEYDAGEAFMASELRPGALANVSGLVQYRHELRDSGC
jgi:putative acetyltransferase